MKNFIFMLAAIKVALKRKYLFVDVYSSKLSLESLNLLIDLGYIFGYTKISKYKIRIFLKYINNKSVIKNIFLVSKPSKKIYFNKFHVRKYIVKDSKSFFIYLTQKGLLVDLEALLFKIGGIPLFCIS